MKSYTHFLVEQNVKKLKHLEHLPEGIINLGFDGARESINILRDLRDVFRGNSNISSISIKFDGAPALIFGIDPSDNQFFCGTKGVFAKTPKLVKSKSDLDTFGYGGELRKKLETALEVLPKVVTKGIYQGDMMFTKGDLKKEKIDGENFYTFTPNTITYAVPAESDLAKTMLRAKLGIVLHTTYTGGPDFESMTAQPGQIDISNFKKSPDVWYDDPYIKDMSGVASMTASETMNVTRNLSAAGKIFQTMNKKEIDNLLSVFDGMPSSVAGAGVKTFVNSLVRSGRLPQAGKGRTVAKEYMEYVDKYWTDKVMPKIKSDAGRTRKLQELEDLKGKIDVVVLSKVLDFMAYVNDAMMVILNKLSQLDNMKTFVADGDGYRVTSGEGFVVSDKITGNTWKIVDRLDFSAANFANVAKFGQRG